MNKEDFIRIINGFDIKNINEYWLRVKGSDDLNFELMQGFDDIKKSLERLDALEDRINKALELLDSYKLGKYDYALTPAGLLEFEDILRGKDNE